MRQTGHRGNISSGNTESRQYERRTMLKELNTPSARVGRIKELYEAARDAYAPALEEYERNLRQYLGTDEKGRQNLSMRDANK